MDTAVLRQTGILCMVRVLRRVTALSVFGSDAPSSSRKAARPAPTAQLPGYPGTLQITAGLQLVSVPVILGLLTIGLECSPTMTVRDIGSKVAGTGDVRPCALRRYQASLAAGS